MGPSREVSAAGNSECRISQFFGAKVGVSFHFLTGRENGVWNN